jgi:hypothetical protein
MLEYMSRRTIIDGKRRCGANEDVEDSAVSRRRATSSYSFWKVRHVHVAAANPNTIEWHHLLSTAGLGPVEPRMTKLEASRPCTGGAIAVPRMPALGPPSGNYYPAPGNAPAATQNRTNGRARVGTAPFVNTRLSFPQAPRPAEARRLPGRRLIDRQGTRLSGRTPATSSNSPTTLGLQARAKATTVLAYVISQGHVCA